MLEHFSKILVWPEFQATALVNILARHGSFLKSGDYLQQVTGGGKGAGPFTTHHSAGVAGDALSDSVKL